MRTPGRAGEQASGEEMDGCSLVVHTAFQSTHPSTDSPIEGSVEPMHEGARSTALQTASFLST